jgi:hypothetical protein
LIDLNNVAYPPAHQVRYDLDAIVAELRATAQTWVPRLFPNGRRVGDEWRLANIKGAPPRKQGSCVIALKGEHAGDWHDFDGSQGGGPFSTIEEATGFKGRELFAQAAELTGRQCARSRPQQPRNTSTTLRVRSRSSSSTRVRSRARRQKPIWRAELLMHRRAPICWRMPISHIGRRGKVIRR